MSTSNFEYEQRRFIHTYTHNWPLQPFSQDYGLASHTTHIVCVNFFICEWRDLQFNADSELQIFEKLFHGRSIYSQSFCQKSAERKSPKKYFSYFNFFMIDLGYEPRLFASSKLTHYILALFKKKRAFKKIFFLVMNCFVKKCLRMVHSSRWYFLGKCLGKILFEKGTFQRKYFL